jgi:hypothetical protein
MLTGMLVGSAMTSGTFFGMVIGTMLGAAFGFYLISNL